MISRGSFPGFARRCLVPGGMEVAFGGIARVVLVLDRPERVPGADVGPAGVEPHDDRLDGPRLGGDALHHRIVDGVRWALGEGGLVHAPKAAIALALPVRALARGEDVLAEAR